jgi:hypothetical protein
LSKAWRALAFDTRVVPRVVIVTALVAVVALAVGVLADWWARTNGSEAEGFRVSATVVSHADGHPDATIWRLRVGVSPDVPDWGAILFERYNTGCVGGGRCTSTPLAPVLLTTPEPVGALRVVEHSRSQFVLRSARGWLFSLEFEGNLDVPTLYPLGPRLDPAHLPALAPRGFAVPVTYGRGQERRAVLLVGSSDVVAPTLYGYLDGYALPEPASELGRLERPLLGPDHALYRIDVDGRRLVRVAAPLPGRRAWVPTFPQTGCSSWPASRARYVACPGSITRVTRGGSRSVVFRNRTCDALCRTQSDWGPVLPSPDGRTLLAEERFFTCGSVFWTYFIPRQGGVRTLVMSSPDLGSSEAIGWLNGNEAVVATDGLDDCDPNQSAIYVVDRRRRNPPDLIVRANGHDATAWGF